jgi:hypothetical protein
VALLLAGVLGVRQGAAKVDGLFSAVLDRLGPNAELAQKAKCAGLLGAMVNDLKPLDYQPADARYRDLMDAVLGIFDREKAESVAFAVRLEAAEALGQAGDPRLGWNNWVRIGTFEIGRYPVTVAEYRRFVEDEGYQDERWWKAGGFGSEKEPGLWEEQKEHPNRPVTWVSWYEASAYCAWAGVRLPLYAEWERAVRGTERREYPWGKEEPDATLANYRGGGPGHPTPVGLYPAGATPEGVLDLAGNVWEWVEYSVVRGGSWSFDLRFVRVSLGLKYEREDRFAYIGFRCAREVFVP